MMDSSRASWKVNFEEIMMYSCSLVSQSRETRKWMKPDSVITFWKGSDGRDEHFAIRRYQKSNIYTARFIVVTTEVGLLKQWEV